MDSFPTRHPGLNGLLTGIVTLSFWRWLLQDWTSSFSGRLARKPQIMPVFVRPAFAGFTRGHRQAST
jgi:hypothetical protein